VYVNGLPTSLKAVKNVKLTICVERESMRVKERGKRESERGKSE